MDVITSKGDNANIGIENCGEGDIGAGKLLFSQTGNSGTAPLDDADIVYSSWRLGAARAVIKPIKEQVELSRCWDFKICVEMLPGLDSCQSRCTVQSHPTCGNGGTKGGGGGSTQRIVTRGEGGATGYQKYPQEIVVPFATSQPVITDMILGAGHIKCPVSIGMSRLRADVPMGEAIVASDIKRHAVGLIGMGGTSAVGIGHKRNGRLHTDITPTIGCHPRIIARVACQRDEGVRGVAHGNEATIEGIGTIVGSCNITMVTTALLGSLQVSVASLLVIPERRRLDTGVQTERRKMDKSSTNPLPTPEPLV